MELILQNQTGNNPTKWDKTGDHPEVMVDDQVAVKMPEDQEQLVRLETENPKPEVSQTRPRRNAKPHPKYSPEVYDLSYVGCKPRLRSRRNIRRAGM